MAEDASTSMEKKPRKRLKKLMIDICQQMEFYFSDANLRNDHFLQKELAKSSDRYVSLDVLANFNKIKNMTKDRTMVIMAIQQSPMLELSKDEKLVRRKTSLKPPKYDPDDCMVYVECLPKKADHEWLKRAFSYCGNVAYVSLPRYQTSKDIKGFAFVEFETPREANRACELMNNPPPDARSRAGKFPTMRGRKRIVPFEFDTSLRRTREDRGDRMQGRSEGRSSARRKDRDHSERKERAEEEDVRGGRKSPVRTEKHEDRQKRKRRLDGGAEEGGCHVDQSGMDRVAKKSRDSEKCVDREAGREHRDTHTEEKESSGSRKTQKRKHDEDPKEESSKSARGPPLLAEKGKEGAGDGGGKKQSGRSDGKEKEEKEEEEEEEETYEQRRLRIIQMGRKMMKRKRSLSEGDKWEMRLQEEEEEEEGDGNGPDSDEDGKTAKKSKGDPDKEDRDRKHRESNADVSHSSELDRKKRSRKKKLNRRINEEEEALFLRVIPKREWLELKQEYLELQRESLSSMKESLRNLQAPARNVMGDRRREPEVSSTSEAVQEAESSSKLDTGGPEYVSGTVLKLKCFNTTVTRKDIKEHLENICPVAYIDLVEGGSEGHVRFKSAEGPKAVLATDMTECQIALSTITDEEEKAYWEKLQRDRENKLKSKHTKKKKRGVNKILQKAERALSAKTKSHIHFDE